jgi:hypothetical protein
MGTSHEPLLFLLNYRRFEIREADRQSKVNIWV